MENRYTSGQNMCTIVCYGVIICQILYLVNFSTSYDPQNLFLHPLYYPLIEWEFCYTSLLLYEPWERYTVCSYIDGKLSFPHGIESPLYAGIFSQKDLLSMRCHDVDYECESPTIYPHHDRCSPDDDTLWFPPLRSKAHHDRLGSSRMSRSDGTSSGIRN